MIVGAREAKVAKVAETAVAATQTVASRTGRKIVKKGTQKSAMKKKTKAYDRWFLAQPSAYQSVVCAYVLASATSAGVDVPHKAKSHRTQSPTAKL